MFKRVIRYKIVEEEKIKNEFNRASGLYTCKIEKIYRIYRRGRILGFWHGVGDWLYSSGGNFCCADPFDSYAQAESYIPGWHRETFGNLPYEIEISR